MVSIPGQNLNFHLASLLHCENFSSVDASVDTVLSNALHICLDDFVYFVLSNVLLFDCALS